MCKQWKLKTYTTHEMVLKVELANARLVLFESFENLGNLSVFQVSNANCYTSPPYSNTLGHDLSSS
jgi:hypothetical protein